MEKMYQEYKDIAEFRMIYIKEAHASDGKRPVRLATEKGIKEHTNYGERCSTATMLIDDNDLTIPCLIDGMDDAVNKAYSAYPDRVFLVRTDGRLAVAATPGPFGFKPGLKATEEWLNEFKENGEEPALPKEALAAARENEQKSEDKKDDAGSKRQSDDFRNRILRG